FRSSRPCDDSCLSHGPRASAPPRRRQFGRTEYVDGRCLSSNGRGRGVAILYAPMSIVSLPQTVRSLARLRVIAQVLTKHGCGHTADGIRIRRSPPTPKWPAAPPPHLTEPDAVRSVGQRLVRVCEELGPTFIKLGQVAAGRPDILPAPIIEELSKLQDHVAPF